MVFAPALRSQLRTNNLQTRPTSTLTAVAIFETVPSIATGESVRHAVLAAALAFHPRLNAWTRKPAQVVSRPLARAVLAWLDRRRQGVDAEYAHLTVH